MGYSKGIGLAVTLWMLPSGGAYACWEEGKFLCRPWKYDDGSRDDVPMLVEVTADGSNV